MTTDRLRDAPRDVVVVRGPDTFGFLQNLLSQDLDGMADGERRPALMLTPQGKVDVTCAVTRHGDEAWLDTDPGWGEHLAAALTRFKIRTKVDLEVRPAPVLPVEDASAVERARVEAGVPRMGLDLDDSVIPQEAFLDRGSVSFTKGCFVGQELVCRIDTRGHVNRYLRHLRCDDPTRVLAPGDPVEIDGRTVGAVTSSVAGLALGFVRREVEPPARATAGGQPVTVEAIPSTATQSGSE